MNTRTDFHHKWKGNQHLEATEVAFLAVASSASVFHLVDLIAQLSPEAADRIATAAEIAYYEVKAADRDSEESNL